MPLLLRNGNGETFQVPAKRLNTYPRDRAVFHIP